jgi:hypothetical protein
MMRKFTAGMEVLLGTLTPVKLMVNEPVVIALTDATPLVAVEPVTPDTGVRMMIELGVTIEDVTIWLTRPPAAAVRTAVPLLAPPAA